MELNGAFDGIEVGQGDSVGAATEPEPEFVGVPEGEFVGDVGKFGESVGYGEVEGALDGHGEG